MFKILLHRRAEKNLYKLPKHILRKFYELMNTLEANPVPWREWDVRKLRGFEDTYRIRLNNYRVIYSVNWKRKEIIILKIEKRGKAYT